MAVSKELLKKIRQLDPGKNKYHNKNTSCLSKHVHQSKAEADYCNRLLAMQQAGEIKEFKIQVPFEVAPEVVHVVDFLVMNGKVMRISPLGKLYPQIEVHEVKGFQTGVWKIKSKLFREKYPEIPYIIINQEEKDGKWERGRRPGQAGSARTSKKGIRSESGMRCNHGEGLKRKGICVICSGLKR